MHLAVDTVALLVITTPPFAQLTGVLKAVICIPVYQESSDFILNLTSVGGKHVGMNLTRAFKFV